MKYVKRMDTENEVKFICPNCMSVVARVAFEEIAAGLILFPPLRCKHCNVELIYKEQDDNDNA